MRKLYITERRVALYFALLCGIFTLSTSCVDNTYDLDKGVDSEMNLFGSLTLPVGSTEQIVLGDMIDVEDIDMLEMLENGDYKISMDDQVTIDIDQIAGEDGVSIPSIVQSQVIDVDFEAPELSSITMELNPFNIEIDSNNLTNVDIASSADINALFDVAASFGDELTGVELSGIELNNQIELSLDETNFSFDLIDGVEVPEHIVKTTNLTFNTEASITLDVSKLYNVVQENSFSLELDYIELTFPEGFVLDSGSNVFRVENIDVETSQVEFTFQIIEYNKEISRQADGLLEKVSGEISCVLPPYATVKGTTNGQSISDLGISIGVDSQIVIEDVAVEVSGLSIEVGGSDKLSDVINIETDNLIKRVNTITIDNSANDINIDITSFSLLEGLSCEGEDVKIAFPKDKFTLNAISSNKYEYDNDNSYLCIPISDIVGNGYNGTIEIETLVINSDVTEGVGDASNYIEFDPNITMEGTSIIMGGSVLLSNYNEYVKLTRSITADIKSEDLLVENADIVFDDYISIVDPTSTTISESVSIPDEIIRIDSMLLRSTNPSYIDLLVSVDLGGIDSSLSFEDYTISFPKFLKFTSDAGVNSDNELILNEEFSVVDGIRVYTTTLQIESLDFTSSEYEGMISGSDGNKMLDINDAVSFMGGIKIASDQINSNELSSEIKANVDVTISEIDIATVYGLLSPDIPTEESVIDLSSLSESMDGELSMVLSDPMIIIEASNPLAIPIQISTLELVPTKDGEALRTLTLTAPIEIAAATADQAATSKIYITADESYTAPESTSTVAIMSGLKSILEDLPDTITLRYGAEAVEKEGENHMIDLYEDYTFALNYSLDIPLQLDELSFDYTTTVNDLSETLESLVDYVSSLSLEITVDNTIPLNLTISSITPVDAAGNALTALDKIIDENCTIYANSESLLEISLTDNAAGDLAKVDGLDIVISATIDSSDSGVTLNAEQYIQLFIVAVLPEGITINFDEM